MRCPHCHKNGSRVVDSRPSEDGSFIRRRRECIHCGFRFTTFERYEETPLLVIKKMARAKNSVAKRSSMGLCARRKNDRLVWSG